MTLLLHVLMLFLLSSGSARVVQDFEQECGKFFAGGKSPTRFSGPPRYEQICQTLNGDYYATYYDTYNRIPVYSAYKFEGRKPCNRPRKWLIEPQLDNNNSQSNMQLETQANIERLGDRQALNGDYVKPRSYHKGHLVPVSHRNSESCVFATFTLTNAAPQDSSFNFGKWRVLERDIATNITKRCPQEYSAFIVTGVVPSTENFLNNRMNVPSHFWTAYCCLDQNNKCQISRGFIGKNKNITPLNITVSDLNIELAILYKVTTFEVFNSKETMSKVTKIREFRITPY